MKTPCPHLIWDLFGKKIKRIVSGRPSSGPGDPIFLRYNKAYPELVDNIDYTNLKIFDIAPWRGTFVEQMVVDVKALIKFLGARFMQPADYYITMELLSHLHSR